MIEFHPVTSNDMHFLYDLLEERETITNISHHSMPTWEQHLEYWNKNLGEFREVYVIVEDGKQKGYIYVTVRNEVGIFIKSEFKSQGIGSQALNEIMKKNKGKRLLANVNPKNSNSIDFFTKHGFKHVQNTYECISE